MEIKINDNERKVLKVLADSWDDWGEGGYFYFRGLVQETKLDLKQVRRACRSLAKKGLAEFKRGLFDQDGMVAGSGYGATKAGAIYINGCVDCKKEVASFVDGRCTECWEKRSCTKCGKAYQDHETDWSKGGYKVEFEFTEQKQEALAL